MHDGIADHGDFEDLLRCGAALLCRLAQQLSHRGAHRGGHLPLAAGMHHHVRDAAHEILAESNLRVHRAGRRNDLARREIADVRRNRGRADVDRGPVRPVPQAGPHRDDVAVAMERSGDAPIAGPQCRLKGREHFEAAAQVLEAPLLAQRRLDPAQIAGGLVHVGRRDFDEAQPHDRVHANLMHLGALADDLPMDLAVGRDVNDGIALDRCRTAQPAPRGERCPLLVVTPFDGAECGQVFDPGTHPVLGKLPVL